MKLTFAQKEEFYGVFSRGNKAEATAWLAELEAGFPAKLVAKAAPVQAAPASKAAPSKWQADLLAKSKKK
jgi:hypothetical protein